VPIAFYRHLPIGLPLRRRPPADAIEAPEPWTQITGQRADHLVALCGLPNHLVVLPHVARDQPWVSSCDGGVRGQVHSTSSERCPHSILGI